METSKQYKAFMTQRLYQMDGVVFVVLSRTSNGIYVGRHKYVVFFNKILSFYYFTYCIVIICVSFNW